MKRAALMCLASCAVLANACGPCIGQWRRDDAPAGPNVIVTSFNRNFPARNDGNENTLAFIGSPETVVGMALTGRLDGSFLTDFEPPVADDLPARTVFRGPVLNTTMSCWLFD